MRVRPVRAEDREHLLSLWEASVRATHHFLDEHDIAGLRPLVAQVLRSEEVQWWVLESAQPAVVGFLGFAHDSIEALFIDPGWQRQGGGSFLVAHAQALAGGALSVDVNEQNADAVRFYQALGFSIRGRSPTDGAGRPFPLLHLERPAPAGSHRPPPGEGHDPGEDGRPGGTHRG